MEKMVYKAIIRYLKKHYPRELDKIVKRAKDILPDLKAKAPDIGGRENTLANNLDMFLLFLSFYEASDHRMAGEAIDEIIADLYARLKFLQKKAHKKILLQTGSKNPNSATFLLQGVPILDGLFGNIYKNIMKIAGFW